MTDQTLTELLHAAGKLKSRPDGTAYTSLAFADEMAIAGKTCRTLREIECAALVSEIVPERYSRNQKYISCREQLRLLNAHVAVIGLGGLGGTVVEILARLGVGTLTLVDGDTFDESNLNRQVLSSPARLGQLKTLAAKERVAEVNPATTTIEFYEFFGKDNGLEILAGVDLAADCLDTIGDRFVLEDACRAAGIPMVSAAVGGTSGQAVAVFPGDPGLRQIYGSADLPPAMGIEASLGTLPFSAIYMAAVECAELTTILLGRPPELRNRLMLAEIGEHTAEVIRLPSGK